MGANIVLKIANNFGTWLRRLRPWRKRGGARVAAVLFLGRAACRSHPWIRDGA
jgi:hypothetical protein